MAVKTTIRTPMPIKQRAKQFMMFDAMKGLTEAISMKERTCDQKRELTQDIIEEISERLKSINKGENISVVYYCQYSNQYRQLSGQVTNIDGYWKVLQVCGVDISFDELLEIRDSYNNVNN